MGQFGLRDWDEVEAARDWPVLLHGNGASCAVSTRFSYPSLYLAAPLSADDRGVFAALRTRNFEEVLDHLRTAALLCEQMGHDEDDALDRYDTVREALIEALNQHHVEWSDVDHLGRLRRIRGALRRYAEVYTTCYDILIYWAVMSAGSPPGNGFVDFFWNTHHEFDPLDTTVRGDKTILYFLHGALHLYRGPHGVTKKRTSRRGTLLTNIATATRAPLFVSEGTAQQKLRFIRRSDYLSFAYECFGTTDDNIVIFGHSLSNQDNHLVRILQKGHRHIAYGVYATSQNDADLRQATIRYLLPGARLSFFDSGTHPLGHRSLRAP